MCCSRLCCGAVLALVSALLLSPKVSPPTFSDNGFEAIIGSLAPIPIVTPSNKANGSTPWSEVLTPREPFCPVVYKTCEVAHSFRPSVQDVIITTPPKTGTTLVQQITHQLRTGGHMNFSDIYDVSPWILVNPLYRGDAADVEQPWQPRLFKNHQSIAEFKDGRHIVVMRNPEAVFQSWYAFARAREIVFMRHNGYLHIIAGLLGLPQSLAEWWLGSAWKDKREFAQSSLGWRRDMAFGVNIFQYIVEFWHARRNPKVLLLTFEDLARNRTHWIPVIGRFMGINVTQELVQKVTDMTSKEFMLQHITRFDESTITDHINQKGLITVPWLSSPKVTQAEYPEIPLEARAQLQRDWEAQVMPSTGFTSYADMRSAWLKEMASTPFSFQA